MAVYTRELFDSLSEISDRAFLVCGNNGDVITPFACYAPPHKLLERVRASYPDGSIKPLYIIRVKPHAIRDDEWISTAHETEDGTFKAYWYP